MAKKTSKVVKQEETFDHIKLSPVKHVSVDKLFPNKLNAFFKVESSEYFTQLRDDISKRGIIVPLVAKSDGVLLAGHNRLLTAKVLKYKTVPVQYVLQTLTLEDERKFVITDNILRRQLNRNERLALYRTVYPDFDNWVQQNHSVVSGTCYFKEKNLKHTESIKNIATKCGVSKHMLQRDINYNNIVNADKNNDYNDVFLSSVTRLMSTILKKYAAESDKTQQALIQVMNEYLLYMQNISCFTVSDLVDFQNGNAKIIRKKILEGRPVKRHKQHNSIPA